MKNAEGDETENLTEDKMITTKTETVQQEVVDKIYCNKCGKQIYDSTWHHEEGMTTTASFGYGSNKDGLCESWSLCDDCYDELIKTFKHPPTEQPYKWVP